MNTMVERVAQAIGEAGLHQSMPMNYDEAMRLARAAIDIVIEECARLVDRYDLPPGYDDLVPAIRALKEEKA